MPRGIVPSPPHPKTPFKCIHDCEGGMEGGLGHFEK